MAFIRYHVSNPDPSKLFQSAHTFQRIIFYHEASESIIDIVASELYDV